MMPEQILKQYFGYDSFRPGQRDIISSILSGQDSLAVMPTGAGKSICYQVPAMLLPGLTVVISPLISLMQDQVKALNQSGIPAAYINSSLSPSQIDLALSYASRGKYRVLYAAPERLETESFRRFAQSVRISMVTVDEAHCISQWGQDFRPSYLKISDFISSLPHRPVVSAFTATATDKVKEDIIRLLELREPFLCQTGFDRPNLFFSVETVRQKEEFILDYVCARPAESGIIYCATRKNTDMLYERLRAHGVPAARYHAGLSQEERKGNQEDFIYDRTSVIVATNAFGMGIDKSNVRYVLHYNMPQSMENYYQEAGRAGRDGEPASCILLFSPQDVIIGRMLLDSKEFEEMPPDEIDEIRRKDRQRLKAMENYCRTTDCLRNEILRYFGEQPDEPCGRCGTCRGRYVERDMTQQARTMLNCVYEMRGRYGAAIVLGTLRGANRARLREIGAVNLRSYGALKDTTETDLRQLLEHLLREGFLRQTDDQYSVIRLGPSSGRFQSEEIRILVKLPEQKIGRTGTAPARSARQKGSSKSADEFTELGLGLFNCLRECRRAFARVEGVPPYVVFSDKTLVDMCARLPRTQEELLAVSGVGRTKLDRYGKRFLEEILRFTAQYPGIGPERLFL